MNRRGGRGHSTGGLVQAKITAVAVQMAVKPGIPDATVTTAGRGRETRLAGRHVVQGKKHGWYPCRDSNPGTRFRKTRDAHRCRPPTIVHIPAPLGNHEAESISKHWQHVGEHWRAARLMAVKKAVKVPAGGLGRWLLT